MYPDNPQFFGKNINTKETIEREPNTSMGVSTLVATRVGNSGWKTIVNTLSREGLNVSSPCK